MGLGWGFLFSGCAHVAMFVLVAAMLSSVSPPLDPQDPRLTPVDLTTVALGSAHAGLSDGERAFKFRRSGALAQAPLSSKESPANESNEQSDHSLESGLLRVDHGAGEGSQAYTINEYLAWVRHHNDQPRYPRLANQRHEQGRVVVRVELSSKGSPPTSVGLEQSSGHDLLDRAALEAVRNWAFPPFQGGSAALSLNIPFVFKLED